MKIRQISVVVVLMFLMLGTQANAQSGYFDGCGYGNPVDLTNRPTLVSAKIIVLGDAPFSDSVALAYQRCKDLEVLQWAMTKSPYNMSAEWNEGIKLLDVVKVLKMFLADSGNGYLRVKTIDNAYLEVYGRPSTPIEMARWDTEVKAQKAWYATIVFAEIKKLNSSEDAGRPSPTGRRAMLDRAFQTSTGRNASDADRGYWLTRTEHHRLIVAAARDWIYAPSSAGELIQTVRRALTVKNGKAPSDADIKNAMANYNKMKPQPIYSEMIK